MNAARATSDDASIFLQDLAAHSLQKTVDGYQQAIQMVLDLKLRRVPSAVATTLHPRAYTNKQIDLLCTNTADRMRLSIKIAQLGGLRAHELDTISAPEEMKEDARPWLKERFIGRKGVRYIVAGKGGLRRAVMLDFEIAASLEELRLPLPVVKKEREINYVKRFGLIGGQEFSRKFTDLSNAVLGWSTGAHGLRHRFAQDRIQYLQLEGFYFQNALEIVAQELGHFSTKNTLSYLR